MRKYDTLAISLLLFTFVFGAWLGISGPIHWGFEGSITLHRILDYLQKWQTLAAGGIAIVVAMIAYHGAKLAYRGAMAKVDLDRETASRLMAERRIGIQLRLRFAIARLVKEAENVKKTLRPYSSSHAWPYQIVMNHQNEFDDAWKALDQLPINVSVFLDMVQVDLPRAKARLDTFPPGNQITIAAFGPRYADPLYMYLEIAEKLIAAGTNSLAVLGNEIATLEKHR